MTESKDPRMSDAAARPAIRSQDDAGMQRRQKLMTVGGILGALAASSCCILPLVLFSVGVSGAWIGNFTQLAPYQPYFIAATIACLGYAHWLVSRSSKAARREGGGRAQPRSHRPPHPGPILAHP